MHQQDGLAVGRPRLGDVKANTAGVDVVVANAGELGHRDGHRPADPTRTGAARVGWPRMEPARLVCPGDWVEAHTEVERIGRTLAFADCSLTVEGREVVRGRAVYAAVAR